jgi:hypothetical protein
MYDAAVADATASAVASCAARLAASVASLASLSAASRPRRSTSHDASNAPCHPVER